eukprot:m.64903 g.64903  ORF g.64903 m.64903 type:complete len:85 (+) comp8130_c0_seq1:1295-1549(+)
MSSMPSTSWKMNPSSRNASLEPVMATCSIICTTGDCILSSQMTLVSFSSNFMHSLEGWFVFFYFEQYGTLYGAVLCNMIVGVCL